MILPRRLQLSRRKGFDLQAHSLAVNGLPAVNCARPHRWSNPFPIDHEGTAIHCLSLQIDGDERACRVAAAIDLFAFYLGLRPINELVSCFLPKFPRPPSLWAIRHHLHGNNLACWCPLCSPCHCDVLLVIANAPGDFICKEAA